MNKQEEPFEEEMEWEKKKEPKGKEAGIGSDGELSSAAMKRWLLWAGLAFGTCLLLGLALAAVSSLRDRKEAAGLEADFGNAITFKLNRKGTIIEAGEGGETLVGDSLEQGLYNLLDLLSERKELLEGEGLLITLWPSDTGLSADVSRFVKELEVYAETGLRRKQSNTVIYVSELPADEKIAEIAGEYGISMSRAAFIKGLVDKNTSLKLSDIGRLAGMSLKDLLAEVAEKQYTTSFDTVTAKRIYEKMTEESSAAAGSTEGEEEQDEALEEETGNQTETESAATATSAGETAANGPREEESQIEEPASTEEEPPAETEPEGTEQEETGTEPPETTAGETDAPPQAPPETTAVPTVAPETSQAETTAAATAAPETTAPETTVPETTAPLEPPSISPAETSPEEATLAPYQVGPGYTETEDDRVYEVIPVAPGSQNGPGY